MAHINRRSRTDPPGKPPDPDLPGPAPPQPEIPPKRPDEPRLPEPDPDFPPGPAPAPIETVANRMTRCAAASAISDSLPI